MIPRPPRPPLFLYTTLFRSSHSGSGSVNTASTAPPSTLFPARAASFTTRPRAGGEARGAGREQGRSEEHTSELQSLTNLVCRLLLEKKKKIANYPNLHKCAS